MISPTERKYVVAALAALMALLCVYAVELASPFLPVSVAALFAKLAANAVIVGSGLLCLAAASRREDGRAWRWLGAGVVCWGLGNVYFAVALWDLKTLPIPSPADGLWLLFYPMMYRGLVLLLRDSTGGIKTGRLFEGVLAGLVASAVSAALVFESVASTTTGPAASIATTLAYPIGDFVLLGLVAGALAMTGWRVASVWGWIAIALIVFLVADGFYLSGVADGTWTPASIVGAGWPLAALVLALGAWHSRSDHAAPERTASTAVAVPVGFGLVGLVLLVSDHFRPVNVVAVLLAATAMLAVLWRVSASARENQKLLSRAQIQASTDPLTGLANRRKLMTELEARLERRRAGESLALTVFDLDGFKQYNDTFGHPAGDALLQRLGQALAVAVPEGGHAFRVGGDEFCALYDVRGTDALAACERMAQALTEQGEGFTVGCSYGSVVLPQDAASPNAALALVDRRLYANKNSLRAPADRQSSAVLMQALTERDDALGRHVDDVAVSACATAERLGVTGNDLEDVRLAAQLHDVGKVAIPEAILSKPGPLTDDEWQLMRRHTLIGERITAAAPALARVGRIIRSSHERFDGDGYPDRLAADEIPLAARIIAVCDAYDAMTSQRPYRPTPMSHESALPELRRAAGTQFDANVVDALAATLVDVPDPARARTDAASTA